ncbi:hypothetical protein BZA05DRAFT_422752 [Tricharina praecox]|uniref:uncharacterized protein n=1 Tax=Tricharina praecox TaxID=43433 RepID=UPI00221E50BD|nr:uncharacterized protein BZA05DRAFT_422752 [Tricharina praecox]KAI5841668.1 hypothetical protein BZA05DRAFT_422752 [Tricharina praecox]
MREHFSTVWPANVMQKMWAQDRTFVKNQKNEYFIIDVRQGSDILLRDYRVFFQCVKLKRCQITSCYERRATQGVVVSSLTGRWTKGGAMMRVVTQECATFCFPANAIHMQLGIDVDHSNMYATDYRSVSGTLRVSSKHVCKAPRGEIMMLEYRLVNCEKGQGGMIIKLGQGGRRGPRLLSGVREF